MSYPRPQPWTQCVLTLILAVQFGACVEEETETTERQQLNRPLQVGPPRNLRLPPTKTIARPPVYEPPPTQRCGLPNVEMCRDSDYMDTRCGRLQRRDGSYCERLLGREFGETIARLDDQRRTTKPLMTVDGAGTLHENINEPINTHLDPFDFEDASAQGDEATYAALVKEKYIGAVNPGPDGDAARARAEQRRRGWAANGNAVTDACAEYVFEKYYDYERFEDRTIGFLGDGWAFVEAAYGPNGIAGTVRSRNGRPLAALGWPDASFAKNTYFTFRTDFHRLPALVRILRGDLTVNDDELADLIDKHLADVPVHLFDEDIVARLRRGSGREYTESWDWHERAMNDLRGYAEDWLEELHLQQAQFATLLERRTAILASFDEVERLVAAAHAICRAQGGGSCNVPDPWVLYRQRLEALYEADVAVEQALQDARRFGCLETHTVTPCDWQPRRFAKHVRQYYLREREQDYQLCLARTGGDDFSLLYDTKWMTDSWGEGDDSVPIARPVGYYTRDHEHIEAFFSDFHAWFNSQEFPMGPDGQPRLGVQGSNSGSEGNAGSGGDAVSDDGTLGSSDFNVIWGYGLGWRVEGIGPDQALCDAALHVYGDFELDGTAFGLRLGEEDDPFFVTQLRYASDNIDEDGDGGTDIEQGVYLGAELGGHRLFDPLTSQDLRFDVEQSTSAEYGDGVEVIIPVAGIPISLEAGIAGKVGVDVRLTVEGGLTCQEDHFTAVDAETSVTPYAELTAYAEVGVDLLFIEVGARVNLTIVAIRVPFSAGLALELYANDTPPRLYLTANSRLDVEFRALDGSVVIYVDFWPVGYEDYELFRWDGLSESINLVDVEWLFPLHAVRTLLGA